MSLGIPGLERYAHLQKMAKGALDGVLLVRLRYAKIKGETLYFVFGHESMKMEFRYKKEHILERLREYYRANAKELRHVNITFKKIEAAVVVPPKAEIHMPKRVEKEEFAERATGNFEIRCRDERHAKLFRDIQQSIKKRRANC